jgi:hypothetical protein
MADGYLDVALLRWGGGDLVGSDDLDVISGPAKDLYVCLSLQAVSKLAFQDPPRVNTLPIAYSTAGLHRRQLPLEKALGVGYSSSRVSAGSCTP